jgi:hypothetical protein
MSIGLKTIKYLIILSTISCGRKFLTIQENWIISTCPAFAEVPCRALLLRIINENANENTKQLIMAWLLLFLINQGKK